MVDGLLAVPIDISAITATMTFDGASHSAMADATVTYTVGPVSGNSIFDSKRIDDRPTTTPSTSASNHVDSTQSTSIERPCR